MDAFGTTALDNSYRPSTFDRVISGLGNSLSTLWDKRDDISTNIVTASQGAVQGAQNMLVNAPTYAKVPLYVATSFTLAATAVPVVEVAVTTVVANPIMMIEIIEGAEAYYFGGKAPDGGLSGGIGTTMSYYKNNGETP